MWIFKGWVRYGDPGTPIWIFKRMAQRYGNPKNPILLSQGVSVREGHFIQTRVKQE